MPKIDNEITDARIKAVAELILEGYKTRQIYVECKEQFKLQNRQIDNLIARAKDHIKTNNSLDISFEKSKFAERMELLFGKAFEMEDYRTCLNILSKQAEFYGLDAVPEQTVTLSPLQIIHTNLTISDEKELAELREFKKQHSKKLA